MICETENVKTLKDKVFAKVMSTYFVIGFLVLLSAYLFPEKADVPIILSLVLLIPLYIWYKQYSVQKEISGKIAEKEEGKVILWIFMLFILALFIRVPSALLFKMPYEKTPLIYLLVLTIVVIEKTKTSVFGFKASDFPKSLFYGLGFYAVWGGITFLSSCVMIYVSTRQLFATSFNTLVFLSTMPFQTLCVGLSEEGFFRGYTQTHLEKIYSPKIAILVQAFLFGAWHFVWNISPFNPFAMAQYMITTFFIGLLFGYFYHKAKNIVPLIIVHGLWNSTLQGIITNETAFKSLQETLFITQIMTLFLPYAISMAASFLFIKFFVKEI